MMLIPIFIFSRLISCFFIRTGIGPLVDIQYFSTGIKMAEFTRASINNNRCRLGGAVR